MSWLEVPEWKKKGIARAIEAALWLLETRKIKGPDELHLARLATELGADVVYRATGAGDGRSWRTGKNRALIIVNEVLRGYPRARWTIAHELAHLLLHEDLDAIARIHGGERQGGDYRYEREADAFAAELLMAAATFGPLCTHEQPTLAHLDDLGAEYGTSLTATGRRYTDFATSACALLECRDGRIKRAARSPSFLAEAVQGRALHEHSAAARLLRGDQVTGCERVKSGAWGAEWLDGEMTEHAVAVPDAGVVLVWLWHTPQ